jgi:hypothetical protein
LEKIQEKMTVLLNDLSLIETCLFNKSIDYSEIVVYLQYGVPLDDFDNFAKMRQSFVNMQIENRETESEKKEALYNILTSTQDFIKVNDVNGSHVQEVFKEAYDVAEEIKKLLVPYSKKAAV